MKKSKIIVPALGMLLLSTAASVTGTFAWFSANNTVTATGMTVKAKSDSAFLCIQYGGTFDKTVATPAKSATSTHADTELYLVSPATTLTSSNVTTPESWHYGYSDDPNSPTLNGSYVACTDLTDYVVSEQFAIGLSEKSGVTTTSPKKLQLKSVTLPANTGISVVVVAGSYCYTHTSNSTTAEDIATAATDTGTIVTVYYFINGDDANTYSNNIAALTGTVTLTFGIEA